MADIRAELEAIMKAVYGEEVRGSIHDAIRDINYVSERSLDIGQMVTSEESSITGYFEDSLYINELTFDLWRCTGEKWELKGNLKGDAGNAGAWAFRTEAEWNAFDKSRMNDGDTIIFLWDRTDEGDSNYMLVAEYVGNSAIGKVHNSDLLENHNADYFAKTSDLGSLKFRKKDNKGQYSLDGNNWINFRNPTGTAIAENVLVGKTFANSNSDAIDGSMPNNGTFTGEITEKDGRVIIPKGYHDGTGYVNATYETGGLPTFIHSDEVEFSSTNRSSSFSKVVEFNIPEEYRDVFNTTDYVALMASDYISGNFHAGASEWDDAWSWNLNQSITVEDYDPQTGVGHVKYTTSNGGHSVYTLDEAGKYGGSWKFRYALIPISSIDKGSIEI